MGISPPARSPGFTLSYMKSTMPLVCGLRHCVRDITTKNDEWHKNLPKLIREQTFEKLLNLKLHGMQQR
jgi:hypothetical protein